jgi:2-furoyl-CoA dehydrogenase large subunit
MSTPVCIANAIADALSLAVIELPATPAKLAVHLPSFRRASTKPPTTA